MSGTKPIPVRLTQAIMDRLDVAAARTGLGNRTAVIKLCLVIFLDGLEKTGYRLPGVDIRALMKEHDGRTHRYEVEVGTRMIAAETREPYGAKPKK